MITIYKVDWDLA